MQQRERALVAVLGSRVRPLGAAHGDEVEHVPAGAVEEPAQAGLGEDPEVGGVVVGLPRVQQVGHRLVLQTGLVVGRELGDPGGDEAQVGPRRQRLQHVERVLQVVEQPEEEHRVVVLCGQAELAVQVDLVHPRG
ncbi:hypothetical protein ACFQ0O_36720 [Saccharopolyspora spinosporotrichia]